MKRFTLFVTGTLFFVVVVALVVMLRAGNPPMPTAYVVANGCVESYVSPSSCPDQRVEYRVDESGCRIMTCSNTNICPSLSIPEYYCPYGMVVFSLTDQGCLAYSCEIEASNFIIPHLGNPSST